MAENSGLQSRSDVREKSVRIGSVENSTRKQEADMQRRNRPPADSWTCQRAQRDRAAVPRFVTRGERRKLRREEENSTEAASSRPRSRRRTFPVDRAGL